MTARRCDIGHKDSPCAWDGTHDQFSSVHRCNGGSYFGPAEAMILMSELPCIPFNMPVTWIVKESCP
jgi:hypothetical protein